MKHYWKQAFGERLWERAHGTSHRIATTVVWISDGCLAFG